jgi:MoxR-like ATPase
MSDTHATQAAPEPPTPAEAAGLLDRVQSEVRRVIVGQDRAIERLIVCLLAQGHCLLEGVPGLAKTLAAETLSRTVGGTFARIQFTPDLLPADVMGTRIFRASREEFDIELGPVFVNFLLADEINRAPAKVQSALLEVMAEHQVSIGGKTFPVPDPFLVLATQNPIESEGVYPLPEAQRDRFLMKVVVGYPTAGEEVDIVYRMGVEPPEAETVVSLEELIGLQRASKAIRVDRAVVDYAVTLVLATRYPANYALSDIEPLITFGGSPRASLGLVRAGRALALMRGRDHLTPQDVFDVAPDVLRHRLVLSYEALAQGVTPDQVLARVLSTVPAPRPAMAAAAAPAPSPAYAAGRPAAPAPAAPAPAGPAPGGPAPAGPDASPWAPPSDPTRPSAWPPQGDERSA